MSPIRDWPGWAQFTLSAVAGAAVVLVTGALTFGDVRHDATDAKKATDDLNPRVTRVEERVIGIKEKVDGIDAKLDRVLEKLK